MGKDDADKVASQEMFNTCYQKHPFGLPVIGYLDNFNSLSHSDVVEYYKDRYVPDKIFLVISGDVSLEKIRPKIQEFFEKPSRQISQSIYVPQEPMQLGRRDSFVNFTNPITRFWMAWKIPSITDKDTAAIDVMAVILGQGRSSRLFRSLKEELGLDVRPGSIIPEVDLVAERELAEERALRPISDPEFASYLMYPDVFIKYMEAYRDFSDLTVLPSSVFFYGMESGEEVQIEIEPGRIIVLRYNGMGEVDSSGKRAVFFELNGQPRQVYVQTEAPAAEAAARRKAEKDNRTHLGAPMPGLIAQIDTSLGKKVTRGQSLLTIEAMKMQTNIRAELDGVIKEILLDPGQQVDAGDLLIIFE